MHVNIHKCSRRICFLLVIILLTSCSGWDDDHAFVPMPDKMFILTDQNELHLWDGTVMHPHATLPYQNLHITDYSPDPADDALLFLCADKGLFRLNTRSLQAEKVNPDLPYRPKNIACGRLYQLTVSDQSVLHFTVPKNPNKIVHILNDYADVSHVYYHAGKFIIAFQSNQIALLSEKALTELYRTTVNDTVRQIMPDRYHRIRIASSRASSDTLWETSIDLNANTAGSKNQFFLAKQLLHTPYVQRPYEREYLQDLFIHNNGTVSGTNLTPRINSIAANFHASRLYAEKDSLWLMYDLQSRNLLASYPKNDNHTKILKGIAIMHRQKN